MFNRLDQAKSLTSNQIKIIAAAIVGDMLEFFDYYLIGFVLAFIIQPWHLTFGQSAIILLSSGVGAILGSVIWGRLADVYGRRKVFIATIVNFSIASGILAFTPENGWWFLSIFRFFVGFGVGGLYCVDLPLVQEFVPARMRGFIGGLVTVFIPLGVMIASSFAAFTTDSIGWMDSRLRLSADSKDSRYPVTTISCRSSDPDPPAAWVGPAAGSAASASWLAMQALSDIAVICGKRADRRARFSLRCDMVFDLPVAMFLDDRRDTVAPRKNALKCREPSVFCALYSHRPALKPARRKAEANPGRGLPSTVKYFFFI